MVRVPRYHQVGRVSACHVSREAAGEGPSPARASGHTRPRRARHRDDPRPLHRKHSRGSPREGAPAILPLAGRAAHPAPRPSPSPRGAYSIVPEESGTASTPLTRLPFPHRPSVQATARASAPRRAARVVRVRAADEDEAQDSSAYRQSNSEDAGLLGKIVSNLPDGRKETAPESYGSRPQSKTLTEGRYRRPPPERVGGVSEQSVRGDDFEVVDGPSFGVGTLVGVAVAAATLGGVYLTVTKLGEGPVKRDVKRMPERDAPLPARVVETPAAEPAAEAPAVAIE